MTDSFRENEIAELPSSESETEQFVKEEVKEHRSYRRKNTKFSKRNPKGTWSDQCLALVITVMGLFAGAAYMVLFSFHEAFPISAPPKGVNLSIRELLTFPRAATEDFLVITTVTTTFILSIGINAIAVCFLFRKVVCGTFLVILSLFTIMVFSLSFFTMLAKFVPYRITLAGVNLKVPATFIVIFYDIYVIILVCAFAYTVQWWRSSRRKQDADVEYKSIAEDKKMAGDMKVLNALDSAKTQWYHFTAIMIAGMGFFTDAYDLFCISLVTKLLGRIYYHVDGSSKPGSLPPRVSAAVNGVAFAGTLAGQLIFGYLGDKMGRKKVYGMTLMLMCICSIASGLSFSREPKTVLATLCFFRFWLGFGIGGSYPLSATIMAEYANKKTRGAFIAAVFAMQGFGILAGGIFAIIISAAFQAYFKAPAYEVDALGSTVSQADYVWRIILMFGAIPALLTYYWRMKMPETARYTALVAKNVKQATADMEKVLQVDIGTEQNEPVVSGVKSDNEFGLFTKQFLIRHGLHLLGTASTWFLLDIAFCSQNLFQKDIFSAIGWIPPAKTMNAIEEVYKIARAQTLIALCSTVPGYWFTVFLIDRIGRFTIQLFGFTMMTAFMFALAIPYHHWTLPGHHIGFVVLYSLTFFFANFGPNTTTFVVPAEIFPARLRSTCHGISAASGKIGAMVGTFGLLYLAQPQDKTKADAGYPAGIGVRNSLIVLGAVNLLGTLCTFLVPESKGKSLEEMSRENEDSAEEGAEVDNHASDNRTVPV